MPKNLKAQPCVQANLRNIHVTLGEGTTHVTGRVQKMSKLGGSTTFSAAINSCSAGQTVYRVAKCVCFRKTCLFTLPLAQLFEGQVSGTWKGF